MSGAGELPPLRWKANMAEFEPVLLRRIRKKASPCLDAYRADGGYRALHKALNEMTPAQVVDVVKASGSARPRRRGLSHRPQVDLPAQGPSRPDLPVRQRRRERAVHLQQSHPHGGGSAPGARRHHPRLLRHAGQHGLRLHPLRIRPAASAPCRRPSTRLYAGEPARQEHPRQGLPPRRLSCTAAPAPTSAARRPG